MTGKVSLSKAIRRSPELLEAIQTADEAELAEADAWEAEHPEEVEQWWYQLEQASLACLWEHPDEDIYTAQDREPV